MVWFLADMSRAGEDGDGVCFYWSSCGRSIPECGSIMAIWYPSIYAT
ncbi:hypothetical protein [Bacillus sp. JCM 19041]